MEEVIKCIIDNIEKFVVVLTAMIAFSVYLFNYPINSQLGNLEIEIKKDEKQIPIFISSVFIILIFWGGGIAYIIYKEIFYKYCNGIFIGNIKHIKYIIGNLKDSVQNKCEWISVGLLIILLMILYYLRRINMNKSIFKNKKTKLIKISKCKICFIGFILGFSNVFIIATYLESDLGLYVLLLCICIFIFIHYLILITSGKSLCENILKSLELYELKLKYNDKTLRDDIVRVYLIGEFNGFFKVRDIRNNIFYINKDEIATMKKV